MTPLSALEVMCKQVFREIPNTCEIVEVEPTEIKIRVYSRVQPKIETLVLTDSMIYTEIVGAIVDAANEADSE